MKKIAFLMLIISVIFTIISCSGSSGGDQEKGYVDPGDWTGKDVKTNKAYTIAGESCAANAHCNAIIYQNRLNNTDFVGIAVKETGFDLKIYCSGYTSIPTGTLAGVDALSPCTVVINGVKTNDVAIEVDITNNGDGTYTIEFSDNVTGTNIQANDEITAVKYP